MSRDRPRTPNCPSPGGTGRCWAGGSLRRGFLGGFGGFLSPRSSRLAPQGKAEPLRPSCPRAGAQTQLRAPTLNPPVPFWGGFGAVCVPPPCRGAPVRFGSDPPVGLSFPGIPTGWEKSPGTAPGLLRCHRARGRAPPVTPPVSPPQHKGLRAVGPPPRASHTAPGSGVIAEGGFWPPPTRCSPLLGLF